MRLGFALHAGRFPTELRAWKLRAPAYRLNDSPAAFRRSLHKYLANSAESLSSAGLRFAVSSLGPRMYFIFRKSGKAVGVITTHIDDISGCGEHDLLLRAWKFPEKRSGELKVQEGSFARVGAELAQVKDFSATLTQEAFAKNMKLLPTSPALRAGRENPLSTDCARLRQWKLGELRWVATVSRADIRARLARIASRISALCRSGVCSWFEW